MKFTPISINGAYLIELEPHEDERGSFARAFCRQEFNDQIIDFNVLQCNMARSYMAGTVRGLHYLEHPNVEQKLVRCISGAVLDVIVDMRSQSSSYRTVFSQHLDNENRKALFIPSGVAHGYQSLSDNTEFMYMTDQFYVSGLERGIRFNDPMLKINWPLPAHGITDRDSNWPLLNWL